MAAAHRSVTYINERIFREAGELPWRFVVGDVAANLEVFKGKLAPSEPIALNIWKLLQADYNRFQLIMGVNLFKDIGWGIVSVEQQHGSVAIVHNFHVWYGGAAHHGQILHPHVEALCGTRRRCQDH